MEYIPNIVHNHGPSEDRGLDCGERMVDNRLRGWCMILGHQALLDLVERDIGRVNDEKK